MDLHHDLDNDGQSLPKDNVVLDKVDNRSSNGDNVDNVVDTVADNIVDNVVEEPSNGQNVVLQPSIDDEVLARQKKLDKGKGVMTKEDTVKNKKQKSVRRGNGISIRENEGPLSSDSDSDEFENCVDYGQYSSESEGNGEGISDPYEKYPIHDDQTHWRLKKLVGLPNQQIADNPSFKIDILSPVGAGKKTFARRRRHVDGDNQMFVDLYHIYFPTKRGGIRFICSDKDTELILHARRAIEGSDGVIIMFDEKSPTYSQASELIFNIGRDCPGIPIVLCINRVDLRHIVNARQLMQLPGNIKYCEISGPSNYNIERPFLLLAMMLVSPSISFMEEMAHLVPLQDLPNQQIADNPIFKIAILGPTGAGKTAFLERHVDAANRKVPGPITGVTVYPIDLRSNPGFIRFNCWDTTRRSQDGVQNLKKRYNWHEEIYCALKYAEGAIIMLDVTEESPYDLINALFSLIDSFCGNIPIVLCGNKVDLLNRNVNAELLAGWLHGNTQYCEISALRNYNLEGPFLFLAQMLVRYDVMFTERPALVPPKVIIDLEALRRSEEFFGAVYRAYDLMQALMQLA